MVEAMAAGVELQRAAVGAKVRATLAVKRSQGIRLGRPPAIAPDVRSRIRDYRRQGLTMAAIVARLEADGSPTVLGGPWRVSTVQRVLASQEEGWGKK
jgi:DNA invertase Pin-like site-specific DNA recombinase